MDRRSTRAGVDLGLRLPDRAPGGRLLPARSTGNDPCTVRVPPTDVAHGDHAVTDLLRQADAANR